MAGAHEHHIHRAEIKLRTETHVSISEEPGVHFPEPVSRIAGRMHESKLHIRMVQQDPDEFAGGIAGTPYDTDPYHFSSSSPSSG